MRKPGPFTAALRKKIFSTLPDLELFVTNRCNLGCKYCFARDIVTGPREATLSLGELKAAVDRYGAARRAQLKKYRDCGPAASNITFTGGEPLLEPGLLAGAIAHIRKQPENYSVTVMTNGTLLTPKTAALLSAADKNLCLCVSLDGGRAVNDSNRKFRSGGGSVFDAVAGNLAKLPKGCLDKMQASLTLTPRTAGSLAGSVDALSRIGFQKIEISLDTCVVWPPESLAVLERALKELKAYYLANAVFTVNGRKELLKLFFESSLQAELHGPLFRQLSFSLDGRFFPCDALDAGKSRTARFAVGDLARGVDLGEIEKVYDELLPGLEACGHSGLCPALDSYLQLCAEGKASPARLANLLKVGSVFERELGGLLSLQKISMAMAGDAEFGDFIHSPKNFSRKEIGSCALLAGGGTLAGGRRKIDYFLYSPGRLKELIINDTFGVSDDLEVLVFYAAAKAKHLGKSLRIRCKSGAGGLEKGRLAFLRENGVSLAG